MGAKQAMNDILYTTGFLYYITMGDFEREEYRKKKKKELLVRRLSLQEKQLLTFRCKHKQILDEFDFSDLQKEIASQNICMESYEELIHFLRQIDLCKCFFPNPSFDTFFHCKIYQGNYAWISRNEEGHCRYFSKKKGQVPISLDFLDFLSIYYGMDIFEAMERVAESFSIQFMTETWKKERKQKYFRNEQFLHHSLAEYPHLSRLIKNHRVVLEMMNVLGNYHLYKKEYTYKGENFFFASTSHIARFLETTNTAKINQLINLFATLGLIEKVPSTHIHPTFLKESLDIMDKRTLGNHISYYIIHPFSEVAPLAEKRAEILLNNGITYSRISKHAISTLFGSAFADMVYPQTVQKNKKRRNKNIIFIEKEMEKQFKQLLYEKGYVTKSMIVALPIFDLTASKKLTYLKKIWSYLLNKHDCLYKKPTKQMKMEYGLDSNEYIAFPDR